MKTVKKIQIGKNGLTPEFLAQLKKIFDNAEHVKVSILRTGTRDKEQAQKIADEIIAHLGNKFTYRLIGYVISITRWRKPMRD